MQPIDAATSAGQRQVAAYLAEALAHGRPWTRTLPVLMAAADSRRMAAELSAAAAAEPRREALSRAEARRQRHRKAHGKASKPKAPPDGHVHWALAPRLEVSLPELPLGLGLPDLTRQRGADRVAAVRAAARWELEAALSPDQRRDLSYHVLSCHASEGSSVC